MSELSKLPNIGKVLEQNLINTGITTPQELKEAGSKQAWSGIYAIDHTACYNQLCALEGAIQGIRWHNLDADEKIKLKEFYNSFQ